ncbi:MAG: hypothetical protein R2880_13355 [Deinococcales bacterium]
MPTHWLAQGIGKMLVRGDWSENATWFNFTCGWNSIDHQADDAMGIELYRQGEWLIKRRVGYGFGWLTSDNTNSLLIQNDPIDRPENDYRFVVGERGSQWPYSGGDAHLIASSFGEGYSYALCDASDSYNSGA